MSEQKVELEEKDYLIRLRRKYEMIWQEREMFRNEAFYQTLKNSRTIRGYASMVLEQRETALPSEEREQRRAAKVQEAIAYTCGDKRRAEIEPILVSCVDNNPKKFGAENYSNLSAEHIQNRENFILQAAAIIKKIEEKSYQELYDYISVQDNIKAIEALGIEIVNQDPDKYGTGDLNLLPITHSNNREKLLRNVVEKLEIEKAAGYESICKKRSFAEAEVKRNDYDSTTSESNSSISSDTSSNQENTPPTNKQRISYVELLNNERSNSSEFGSPIHNIG